MANEITTQVENARNKPTTGEETMQLFEKNGPSVAHKLSK